MASRLSSPQTSSMYVLVAMVFASACSPAASSPAVPVEGGTSADSASATCIAAANAKHTKKPNEPDAISLRHILVKDTESKSHPLGLRRTRGEACLRAAEALDKLKAGADFTKLVGTYSDSPGPANDGALGSVHRADLDPAFADAAFELEPGQMSNVVETAFGFHVIVRTE